MITPPPKRRVAALALILSSLVAGPTSCESLLEDYDYSRVVITNPADGSTFTSPQTVTLLVNIDPELALGVTKVDFFDHYSVDQPEGHGTPTCTDERGPVFACEWTITEADNGPHYWNALAYFDGHPGAFSAPVELNVDIRSRTLARPHIPSVCTDGVDCYCDRLRDPADPLHDANVIFCEDFEDPALNDGKHGWADKYPGQMDSCWTTDEAGELVVEGTCANCCANVVQEGACEVDGEDDCVFDGANTFGHRLRPGQTGGIIGSANFTEKTRTFGVTYALKYSHNFRDPVPAMKTNEFGRGWHCILGCSTWNYIGANHPFTATFFASVPGFPTDRAFDTLVGSASAPQGIAYSMAPSLAKYEWRGSIRAGDDADKQVFAPGQWGCFQMHVRDWGTSSATFRYFFNDKLIHHSERVDMTNLQVTSNGSDDEGVESFVWNHYFNDGFTGDTVSYRLEDNFVVTKGDEPVACTAIGLNR